MIAEGKHEALAIQWSQVTEHEKTGNEEIRVMFEVCGGESNGERATWRGYFTEKTAERTLESLRYMGWDGDDVTNIQGLDNNKVQIVVEHELWDGKVQVKIQWVNRLFAVHQGTPMGQSKKAEFSKRMKELVLASKVSVTKSAAKHDDFPHGHNEKPKVDL